MRSRSLACVGGALRASGRLVRAPADDPGGFYTPDALAFETTLTTSP
jgi:hypothetical protein